MAESKTKKDKYYEGIGRRKTSTARVRIKEAGKLVYTINGVSEKEYFKTEEEQRLVKDPLIKASQPGSKWSIEARVQGGGHHSQAEAVRHGLARALVKFNEEFRGEQKDLGYLKRDARAKERRKFGLKKARKAAQWSKR